MDEPTWGAALTIGNKSMDLEHRLQLVYIEAAEEALRAQPPRQDARKVLAHVYEYANAHFLAENLLMRLHGYPEYPAHSQEHDRQVARIEQLLAAHDSGDTGRAIEMLGELKTSLVEHILRMDRRLSAFVAEHGIPVVRRPDLGG